MSSTPMTLEDALRFSGYTIDAYESAGSTITTPNGSIVVPDMILSKLTWQREESPPALGSAFYLDKLPSFHPDYAHIQLSLILDQFRYRRLGYNTPDEFALAVRRWGSVHLGAMSTLTRRYLTAAVEMPLTDVDLTRTGTESGSATANTSGHATTSDTTESTAKGRDAQSDFPQGQLAGSMDYASGAVDRVSDAGVTGSGETTNTLTDTRSDTRDDTRTEKGRSGRSIMELIQLQRATFENVDADLLATMEPLFLGVFDRSEAERGW